MNPDASMLHVKFKKDHLNDAVVKEHSADEIMSVKEEMEQDVINKSVKVDVASQRKTASLPLMNNPSINNPWKCIINKSRN